MISSGVPRELALFVQPGKTLLYGGPSTFQKLWFDILHGHAEATLRGHLCNARAHLSCAYDSEFHCCSLGSWF